MTGTTGSRSDAGPRRQPVGTCCLVLHSHLPWLAHHGRWPVGEEWLYQAWTGSYLPLVRVLERLAREGRRELLTLGITPVLADQLDDPYCLTGLAAWCADWQLRAEQLAGRRDPESQRLAGMEFRAAQAALAEVGTSWRHGGSPHWRELADAGVIELLAGPATHPVLPLLEPRVARIALAAGLDDARVRFGAHPAGIWAPECGWAPGLEVMYAAAGISHLVLDQAALDAAGRSTARPWWLGDTSVLAFGRDLTITNRIWSSRSGYPAGDWYRDFHAVDADSGFRLWRVTGAAAKAGYDPDAAAAAVERDADDFVGAVHHRLIELRDRDGVPGLVLAAYDTELFGHWWHEGPAFLDRVLRLLPEAGVRLSTLAAVRDRVPPARESEPVLPPAGSWGAGKDFRLWSGPEVSALVADGAAVQKRLLDVLDGERDAGRLDHRRTDLDQLVREALLHLAGDWAFMISRRQAADYAWRRALVHRDGAHAIADQLGQGGPAAAAATASALARTDSPFARLDARALLVGAGGR